MNHHRVCVIVFLAFMWLIVVAHVQAEAKDSGILIGVVVPYNTFGGHFDGEHFFNTGEEILLVPKMEGAFGYGLALGRRINGFDWEFYYLHSSHNFSYETIRDTAVFDAVGANARFYFGSGRRLIRPYSNLGMDFCWVKANHAAMTISAPIRTGSAKFSGIGLYAGLGLGISPLKAVTLYVGGELRVGLFGKGKGVLNESHTLDKLSPLGLVMRSGLVFVI